MIERLGGTWRPAEVNPSHHPSRGPVAQRQSPAASARLLPGCRVYWEGDCPPYLQLLQGQESGMGAGVRSRADPDPKPPRTDGEISTGARAALHPLRTPPMPGDWRRHLGPPFPFSPQRNSSNPSTSPWFVACSIPRPTPLPHTALAPGCPCPSARDRHRLWRCQGGAGGDGRGVAAPDVPGESSRCLGKGRLFWPQYGVSAVCWGVSWGDLARGRRMSHRSHVQLGGFAAV